MKCRRPNVLFIFADDQRFDTVQALGNSDIYTPNIDWLVSQGTTFTRAYIMGGTVAAVCMPSRAMLMTSRSLFHLEDSGSQIPLEHIMLPELFRSAGYDTFGTGKWHNGTTSYSRCFGKGDNIFFGGMDDHWNVPVCHFDAGGRYPQLRPHPFDPGTGSMEMLLKSYDTIATGTHSSELFADSIISFLSERSEIRQNTQREHEDIRPFFAYLSFMAPHDPRTMPQKFLSMYDQEKMSLPEAYMPSHPFDIGWCGRDELLEEFPRTEEAIRHHQTEYYAMITHMDAEIGRVIEALEDTGEMNDTIIVFAGDNGLALGQHGLMGKQSTYDHSVHVPLIMVGPKIPRDERRDNLCYLIDIYPTLCELIDINIPASVEGISLWPVMNDSSRVLRDHLLFAFQDIHRAVMDERYKLIEYAVGSSRYTQLFDHKNDPCEIHNISEKESSAKILRRLRIQLENWRERWDDTGEIFWRRFNDKRR